MFAKKWRANPAFRITNSPLRCLTHNPSKADQSTHDNAHQSIIQPGLRPVAMVGIQYCTLFWDHSHFSTFVAPKIVYYTLDTENGINPTKMGATSFYHEKIGIKLHSPLPLNSSKPSHFNELQLPCQLSPPTMSS